MKRIYLASDLAQAQLLVNMLEQSLIPACVENIHQAGGLGELAVAYPEVWIKRDDDEARARVIVKTFEVESKLEKNDKKCRNCDERNPVNFEWCWACRADLS